MWADKSIKNVYKCGQSSKPGELRINVNMSN